MEWYILSFVVGYYGYKFYNISKQYMIPVVPNRRPGITWPYEQNGPIVRIPSHMKKRKEKYEIDWRKEGF